VLVLVVCWLCVVCESCAMTWQSGKSHLYRLGLWYLHTGEIYAFFLAMDLSHIQVTCKYHGRRAPVKDLLTVETSFFYLFLSGVSTGRSCNHKDFFLKVNAKDKK
jgi:hypothetical protein